MPTYINPDENSENCTIPKQPSLVQHTVLTSLGVISVRRREVKFDIKYMLFGAFQPTIKQSGLNSSLLIAFLQEIHRVLWDALDGLLSTSEYYYKTKGNRPITRPVDIKETFDKCADSINLRMNSYDRQTREFHKQSLVEFHKQLDVNEKLMAQLPEYFFNSLKKNVMYTLGKDLKSIHDNIFKVQWLELEGHEKTVIKDQLRPHLGHPGNTDKLSDLLQKENIRTEKVITLVHEVHRLTLNKLQEKLTEMLEKLAQTSEYFLKAFDKIIVNGDCYTSDVYPEEQPRQEERYGVTTRPSQATKLVEKNNNKEGEETSETSTTNTSAKDANGARKSTSKFKGHNNFQRLPKRRESHAAHGSRNSVMAGGSPKINLAKLNSGQSSTTLPNNNPIKKIGFAGLGSHGKNGHFWPALKYIPSKDSVLEPFSSKSITTNRQTMCHKLVIATRSKFLTEFGSKISDLCVKADEDRNGRLKLIENWNDEWVKDVAQVKGLY